MLRLDSKTALLIDDEMKSIPEKYHKPFNSVHEALGVIREEYLELEQEIFFGEKQAQKEIDFFDEGQTAKEVNRLRIKKEAIQVAAMCARLIQEL